MNQIRNLVKTLPRGPGVYIFEGCDGEIIYIGKASNLRNRVSQYFYGQDSRLNVSLLVRRVKNIRFFQTSSAEEALILEQDLIKKYKPSYNIKSKDDSGNTHIILDLNKDWPHFEITNFVKNKDNVLYFGPFPSRRVAKLLLESIKLAYPIRSCGDAVFFNRIRPCMEYELNRCLAPCCLPVEKEVYLDNINKAVKALKSENSEVIEVLNKKLSDAVEDLRFEDCILYRDAIQALTNYAKKEFFHKGESVDFIGLAIDSDRAFVCFLRTVGIKIVDVTVKQANLGESFNLEAVIESYYEQCGELPSRVFLDSKIHYEPELLRAFFKHNFNEEIDVISDDQIDEMEMRLLKLATVNANHYAKSSFYGRVDYTTLGNELRKYLGLAEIPFRIECLDISNLGDKGICAGISVFIEGEPHRDKYQVFKLAQKKRNDYEALGKAILHRLRKDPTVFDLLIVDGGPGHLSVAKNSLQELGIDRPVVAIAKKKGSHQFERVYISTLSPPLLLKEGTMVHSFIVCLRDEAHKTANNFNRFLRSVPLRKKL
ncbi:MAG: excinuclease ABC subunit UvrC [Deltaproteobacteria bacterium]|nr:excinuclease ABC subunit UvrC [Deltaproteobacteria bacterium]